MKNAPLSLLAAKNRDEAMARYFNLKTRQMDVTKDKDGWMRLSWATMLTRYGPLSSSYSELEKSRSNQTRLEMVEKSIAGQLKKSMP
jgi:hypothetical protein